MKKFDNIYFDIEFAAVNLNDFLPILDETNLIVKFEFIKQNEYKNLINTIRQTDFKFTIEYQNLNASELKNIINNASLKQEDIMIDKLKNLNQLFMKDSMPEIELAEYAARGIEYIIGISEKMFVPWTSFSLLSILASSQIVLGGLLIVTGFGATVGMSFISEGIADFSSSYRIYSTRDFNWTDYSKQKAVSLLISAASCGLDNLVDAGKGLKHLISNNSSIIKSAEELGNVGKTLGMTTGNLKNLIPKYISVKCAESLARESANKGISYLSNSLLNSDLIKSKISESIQNSIKTKFTQSEFIKILRQIYALEKVTKMEQLGKTIDKMINNIMNPNSSFMKRQWNSIGAPLMKGILSDKFGSPFSMAVRIWGTLQGIYEIQTIIDRVFEELNKELVELNRNSMSISTFLENNAKVDKEKATEIVSSLISHSIFDKNHCFNIINLNVEKMINQIKNMDSLDTNVQSFLKDFIKMYSTISVDSFSSIMKSIADKLSDQVIRTIEGQLIAPWTSYCVSAITSKVSNNIQNKYLVDNSQNSVRYADLEKDLKDEKVLSDDNQKFMNSFNEGNTFGNQIIVNANDKVKAFTQAKIYGDATTNRKSDKNKPVAKDVENEAKNVENGQPASIAQLAILKNKYKNVGVKITQDRNYERTQEEIEQNVQIILVAAGDKDQNKADKNGHAYLMNSNGQWETVESKNNDCFYAAFSKALAINNIVKSVDQLRIETAEKIRSNPNYSKVLNAQNWIKDRYPLEANTLLFSAAGTRPKIAEYHFDKDQNENAQYIKDYCEQYGIEIEKTTILQSDNDIRVNELNGEDKLTEENKTLRDNNYDLKLARVSLNHIVPHNHLSPDDKKIFIKENVRYGDSSMNSALKDSIDPVIIPSGNDEYKFNTLTCQALSNYDTNGSAKFAIMIENNVKYLVSSNKNVNDSYRTPVEKLIPEDRQMVEKNFKVKKFQIFKRTNI